MVKDVSLGFFRPGPLSTSAPRRRSSRHKPGCSEIQDDLRLTKTFPRRVSLLEKLDNRPVPHSTPEEKVARTIFVSESRTAVEVLPSRWLHPSHLVRERSQTEREGSIATLQASILPRKTSRIGILSWDNSVFTHETLFRIP